MLTEGCVMKEGLVLPEPKETVYARRRQNLEELVKLFGSRRALAIKIAMTPQQIGEILNRKAGFGDKVTERIETKLNLESGYLDKPISAPEPKPETQTKCLEEEEMPHRKHLIQALHK